MLYDTAAAGLKNRQLALLAFRRNMELARMAILGGAAALLIGTPMRFTLTDKGVLFMRLVPGLIIVVTWIPLTILRRVAPRKIIDRFTQVVAQERAAGRPVQVVSRFFVLLAGMASFILAWLVVMYFPVR